MTRPDSDANVPESELTSREPGLDSGSPLSMAGTLAPPLVAGRYQILGLLGAGGMGSVYRARDTELDELVALKMLREELGGDAAVLTRFRQEAKLARRVTHRNVARTFDIGEHGGGRFLTMELVEGESLGKLLERSGRLSLAAALPILRDICAGVSAAHGAGVVHRDLKPDNVLLGADGRVVVTDFGIARALESSEQAAKTVGGIVGTPFYMAPEQVEGLRDIDARADVYALGVMMFEIFTGEVPWTGDAPLAVAAARVLRPPPDPRTVLPGLPSALAQLILKCMARDRADRLATMDAVATALASAAASASFVETRQVDASPRVVSPRPEGGADKTVAVLPFRNAGAPEDDYLAEGLTDDLIDVLSMTRGLRVRPRGAVAHLRGQDRDPAEVGRELRVEVVILGAVRKTPAGVRANVQLIGTADGFQLWAKRFDRSSADALLINDDAAHAIAAALTVDFTAKPRVAPSDASAIDLYFRAQHELGKYWSKDVSRAVDLFEQAVARAPNDPTILSGCARARVRLAFFGGEHAATLLRLARDSAELAVSVAPEHGEAWAALAAARFMGGDPWGAIRAARDALARAPGLAHAQDLLGRILLEVGDPAEAAARLQTALAIDPANLVPRWDLARMHALLGEWDRADALLDLPADGAGNRVAKFLYRSRFALWRGTDHPELDDPPPLGPEFGAIARTGEFREMIRTRELSDVSREALEQASVAAEPGSRRRALFCQLNAEFYGYVFEVDAALASVQSALDAGLIDLLWMDRCPVLGAVRSDARWAPLRAEVAARARRVRGALDAP